MGQAAEIDNLKRVKRLAEAFARGLLEQLGAEKLAAVAQRNASPQYARACASHDFCDANMVMAQAYREAFDRDPLLSVEAGASELAVEADVTLWNHAWDAARAGGFDPAKIRARVDQYVVELATDAALDEACGLIQAYLGEQTGDYAAMYFSGEPTQRVQRLLTDYLNKQRQSTERFAGSGRTIGEVVSPAWAMGIPADVLQSPADAHGAEACVEFLLSKQPRLEGLIHSFGVPLEPAPQRLVDLTPSDRLRFESFMGPVLNVVRGIFRASTDAGDAPGMDRPRAR